jgi:hypothetical protein
MSGELCLFINGRTKTEGVWKHSAEENIWIFERSCARRPENLHKEEFHNLK